MIFPLFITLLTESLVVIGYSHWGKKPVKTILPTSIFGNLVTQSLLWILLNLFFRQYLITLLIAELLIWLLESFLLYSIRPNSLDLKEATLLSLGMNAASFGLGWFLPV